MGNSKFLAAKLTKDMFEKITLTDVSIELTGFVIIS